MRRSFLLLFVSLLGSTAANAGVTLYSSSAAFNAAINLVASEDFDTRATGAQGTSQTWSGINFAILPGGYPSPTLYIAPANSGYYPTPTDFATKSLTANGDENFSFTLANGNPFSAIGFDVATNSYGPITVSLFGVGNVLIGNYQIPLAASTMGFFGITSTDAITKVTTTDDRGWVVDAGFDNLRIGNISAVPEPASWALMIGGFALAGAAMRRRSGKIAFA